MFSKKCKELVSDLGIDTSQGNYYVRTSLEDMLDSKAHLINTERHSEYKKVEEAYSYFMEDFNAYLDLKDGIYNI
jgi:hypothetical protein